MIRGTNKRIIEISGEENSGFERIVLFLKPDQEERDEQQMLKMAEDYADGVFKTHSGVTMLPAPGHTRVGLIRKIAFAALAALLVVGGIALCVMML